MNYLYLLQSILFVVIFHSCNGMEDSNSFYNKVAQLSQQLITVRGDGIDRQRQVYQGVTLPGICKPEELEYVVNMYKDDIILRLLLVKNNALSCNFYQEQEAIKEYNFLREVMDDQLRVLPLGEQPYRNLFASVNTTGADFAMRVLGENNPAAHCAVQVMDTMLTTVKREKGWQEFLLKKQLLDYRQYSLLSHDATYVRQPLGMFYNMNNNIAYATQPETIGIATPLWPVDASDDNNSNRKKVKKRSYKPKKPLKNKKIEKEAESIGPYITISYQAPKSLKNDNKRIKDNELKILKNQISVLSKNNAKQEEFYQSLFSYAQKVDFKSLSGEYALWLAQAYSGEKPHDVTGVWKNKTLTYKYYKHALKEFNKHESEQLYLSELEIYIPEVQCRFADFLCKEKMKEHYNEACTLYTDAIESGHEEAQFRRGHFYLVQSNIDKAYHEYKEIIAHGNDNVTQALGCLFSAYLLVSHNEWSRKQGDDPMTFLQQYCDLTSNTKDIECIASKLGNDDLMHVHYVVYYLLLCKKDCQGLNGILYQMGRLFHNVQDQDWKKEAFHIWMYCGRYGHIPSLEMLADCNYVHTMEPDYLYYHFEHLMKHKDDVNPRAYASFYDEIKTRAGWGYFTAINFLMCVEGDHYIETIINTIINHEKRDRVFDEIRHTIEEKPEILADRLDTSTRFQELLAHNHNGARWLQIRVRTQLMYKKARDDREHKISISHYYDEYKSLKKICETIDDKSLYCSAYHIIAEIIMCCIKEQLYEDNNLEESFSLLFDIVNNASDSSILKVAHTHLATKCLYGLLKPEFKNQLMEMKRMNEDQLLEWCVVQLEKIVADSGDISCRMILSTYWLDRKNPSLQEIRTAQKYLQICRNFYAKKNDNTCNAEKIRVDDLISFADAYFKARTKNGKGFRSVKKVI